MLFVIFSSSHIFSLSLIFFQFDYCVSQSDYYVSLYVPSWLILNRSLDFLDLGDCFLSHVKQFFSYSLFKHFHGPFSFSSPFGTPHNLFLFSFWDPPMM